jgi:nucleotide-binding universal stress UspA family protein
MGDLPARERVVVGYNGKPHSRHALLWAAEEAVRRRTPLLVIYAANYPGMTIDPGPGLLEPEPGALDAAREVTVRGVSEALVAQHELRVMGATEVTSPSQALVDASSDAGLLVIGSRGYGRVVGALLGSVAFAVAARAECPVLVVKGRPRNRPAEPRRRIVVGTDGSDHAGAALDFAADRAAVTGADLEVVTCTGEHPDLSADQLRASATVIAGSAAERLRDTRPGLAVTTRVEDCAAERLLVDVSAEADLVVVGTRGRGAFQGLLLGSVSHAVIHGARCDVAVVDERSRGGQAPAPRTRPLTG